MSKKSLKRKETIELEDGKGYIVFMENGVSHWLGFSDRNRSLDSAVLAMKLGTNVALGDTKIEYKQRKDET